MVELDLPVVILPHNSVLFPRCSLRVRTKSPISPTTVPSDVLSLFPELEGDRSSRLAIAIPQNVDGSAILGIGCFCYIDKDSTLRGLCRAQITEAGGIRVKATLLLDNVALLTPKLLDNLQKAVTRVLINNEEVSEKLNESYRPSGASSLVDLLASIAPVTLEQRLNLFKEENIGLRTQKLITMLDQADTSRPKTSALVRKGIRKEGPEQDEIAQLQQKLSKAELPPEGRKIVDQEFKKLRRMSPQQMDYNVSMTYLDTLADIPWNNYHSKPLTEKSVDEAQHLLDEDHFGLEKVKRRLVEYVAVSYLRQRAGETSTGYAPILLLVGPPGVGKTSLAKSVAKVLHRELYRISLGGVRDEAEIRGHRRTYVGALPGTIVQGVRKAGSMNSVLVLDEIDKVGNNPLRGDPAAALLEVLDPAQNNSFVDHYVGFPVDLSKIVFIATANTTATIAPPLLDRMEVIHIEGYTHTEKEKIAAKFLLPRQQQLSGLKAGAFSLDKEALHYLVTRYTYESGVRNVERQLGALSRAWALEDIRNQSPPKHVQPADVRRMLGVEPFHDDVIYDEVDLYTSESGEQRRRHIYGLVNGLAYMGSGQGGLLTFEATIIPAGKGQLKLTGKLGEVISESAQIAMTWVRANAAKLGFEVPSNVDFHLHAPAGAIPKDGPSAGVAMAVCLVSLLSKRPVSPDLAMTGELTLRGKVLPVGGVREKLLGAQNAGIKRVLLPFHCRPFVEDMHVKLDVDVVYVKYMSDVLTEVWPDKPLLQHSML